LLNRFIKDRDEAAVTVLIERHGPMVLGICRRVLRHAQDAEDACQAAFLVLVRNAASVRKTESLASWLHGVAFHVATNLKRDRARRRGREGAAAKAACEVAPEDLTWREVRLALDEELARLPERLRAPLVLCYLEGKTRDEAARQLRWTLGTLRGRLDRGRELLCARLTRRGLSFSAAVLACKLGAGAAPAAVSPTFAISTIKAVMLTGIENTAAAGVIPANVAALAEGALRTMSASPLKLAIALLVSVVLTGAGLAVFAQGTPRADANPTVRGFQASEQARPARPQHAKPGPDPGRPVRSLPGHTDRLTSVACSPDGTLIATASWDGTARLWDAQTAKEVRRLDVPPPRDYKPAHLSRILFSPDNEYIVVAQQAMLDEAGVLVWKRRTGEKVHQFPGGTGSVAISPDGSLIACGGYGVIRLYGLATGKVVQEMHGQQTHINSLTFSPDGKTIVATGLLPRPARGDGLARLGLDPAVIRVWDVASRKERPSSLKGLELAWVGQCVAQSPDGRTLALDNWLCETATGGGRASLIGYDREVCAVAFSPDGRTLATGSADGTVRLWDVLSGKELGRFGKEVGRGQGGWVLAVAFSPDGRTLVSGGLNKTAEIWDVSRITGRQRAVAERSPADLEADWKDLAGDATTGHVALGRLVCSPGRAVAFLGKKLQSAEPVDPRRIERLIADLDHEQFKVRARATTELQALREDALPALRKARAGNPSLEARRRLDALLDWLDGKGPSAETARQIRAVEALESIGNPEARRLLDQLAAGPAETRLALEARAATARLARRTSVTP
jgi:RNA polymerase sigma factor (sigma-70 family)